MIAGRELFFNNILDKNIDTPVYYQLYTYLKELIVSRTIHLGDIFPSESEFCTYYDISRTTVRQAFADLEKEDLIVRIKGKGTFVSEPKFNRTLNNLYSFSDEITSLGLETHSEVLSFELIDPDQFMIEKFSLFNQNEKKLFKIVRLRSVENSPLTLETVYIPRFICPVLSKELLQSTSLYKILHQFAGIIPSSASEVYSSVNLSKEYAKLLCCSTNTSAFLVDRISYDIHGTIFELAHIFVRGDRCRYEVELKANNVSFLRQIDKDNSNY